MPIVLNNVTVSYRRRPAIHHVHAQFDEGTAWAIVGANGAGKSTLLQTVMRLLPCDTGTVQWAGLARRDVAYLPQQSEIDRSLPMTVLELAALGLWHPLGLWRGMRASQRHSVMQALEQVGMDGHAARQIGTLSRGQFQRVLFARMLVQDARFLLLDEPFNAVDARTTDALLVLLHDCVRAGKGVIAVVHDRSQARQHFAHALLLAREVVAAGRTADVLTPQRLAQADAFRCDDADASDAWCRIRPDDLAHVQPNHGHQHVNAPARTGGEGVASGGGSRTNGGVDGRTDGESDGDMRKAADPTHAGGAAQPCRWVPPSLTDALPHESPPTGAPHA